MYAVYGKENCIWCTRAKELLDYESLPYEYFDIEKDSKALAEFKFIFRDAKTVPQIASGLYDEVQVIGGYTDLTKHLKYADI